VVLYRFYPLDAEGHISGPPQDVECYNDDEATRVAAALRGGQGGVEVWIGTRMVAHLKQIDTSESAWWSPVASTSTADRGKPETRHVIWGSFLLTGWQWAQRVWIEGIQPRHRAHALRASRTAQAYERVVR
jgi:hypothetical protein